MNFKSLGSLTIIESETGSGKTEAAIDYFFQLRSKGLVDRLYFALPSRTSAAQIHGRVRDAVSKHLGRPTPVILAVPGYLTKEDAKTDPVGLPSGLGDSGDDDVESWFSSTSKRYLSAPVAVGTIDQVLMSVLTLKYQTMRWASLGRTLIVVDEVHASDAYMGQILRAVVKRHVDRGGHCLLMSATLGSALADNLLAEAGHVPLLAESLDEYLKRPYPAVHHYNGKQYSMRPIPTSGAQKLVAVSTSAIIDSPEKIAALAKSHYLRGAKVLVIRNSVQACIDVHKLLEADPEVGSEGLMQTLPGVAAPHHGRYASGDRFVLDNAVEATFGKRSAGQPVILCATQTVEQSLDIDADVVITDICPIDVLLQRIGRLHRHEGKPERVATRPEGYEQAQLIVLTPTECVTDYARKPGHGIGKNRAYDDVRIIYLTLKLLKERKTLQIPDDNRELVELATNDLAFAKLEEENEFMSDHAREYIGKILAERTLANENIADFGWQYGDAPQLADEDVHISSRLGARDVVVTLKNPIKSLHGAVISEVKIPFWMINGTKFVDEDIFVDNNKHGETLFELFGKKFQYGQYGLEVINP